MKPTNKMNTTTTTEQPATVKQTFALFVATEHDFRPLNLSKEKASQLIAACQPLRGNKPAAYALCLSMLNGEQLPPPPAEINIKTKVVNFGQIWDEAHAAGMEAYNAYNGGWYPCGFASVIIKPATSPFAKWCRKNKGSSKSYYGGEEIWVGLGSQIMYQKAAYASAFAGVLQKHGIDARVKTAVD